MIKYSLIVLAAAAVIMSSGCDDSECCGGAKSKPTAIIKPIPSTITGNSYQVFGNTSNDKEDGTSLKKYEWFKTTNMSTSSCSGLTAISTVANPNISGLADGENRIFLKVTDKDGNTDCTHRDVTVQPGDAIPFARITPSLGTCTPGATINISGESSTDDGSVASYAWTGTDSTSGSTNTITCPQTGSKKVCLVVTDNTGNKSTNTACETITAISQDCKITATLESDTNTIIDGAIDNQEAKILSKGTAYIFKHNCGDCTWTTLHSTSIKGDYTSTDSSVVKRCITDGNVSNIHATKKIEKDDAGNFKLKIPMKITTCSDYKEIKIGVTCETPDVGVTNYFKL